MIDGKSINFPRNILKQHRLKFLDANILPITLDMNSQIAENSEKNIKT